MRPSGRNSARPPRSDSPPCRRRPRPKRSAGQDLLNADVVFAVPDDALNLFPSIVQAAIGFFAKGPIGSLSDAVALMFRYRTLRVAISAEEAAVLRALKAAKTAGKPALAPADLRERLSAEGLLPAAPLETVLAGLLAKKTEKTILVREVDGRWSIGNV